MKRTITNRIALTYKSSRVPRIFQCFHFCDVAIVMIGEIGGDAEECAADYIKANVSKPLVGYVA
jgi:hypothetical protein